MVEILFVVNAAPWRLVVNRRAAQPAIGETDQEMRCAARRDRVGAVEARGTGARVRVRARPVLGKVTVGGGGVFSRDPKGSATPPPRRGAGCARSPGPAPATARAAARAGSASSP